ncbi:MAG: hypothetical protein CMH54_03270 [Myxococcales bacterium]|nr:hypothetical protein [Myxococcales bacterium]
MSRLMYEIRKSIDIDFGHHIRGHSGACINFHGHTWKFEVGLGTETLTEEGFVIDFKQLKEQVLMPCHALLDHSLAMGAEVYETIEAELVEIGGKVLATREEVHGQTKTPPPAVVELFAARNCYPGGLKIAVFPFSPTSERMARWLYELADKVLGDDRVKVQYARIYETLHPVESVAEYRP